MQKNILVLGGNGFLGSQILRTLNLLPNIKLTTISRSTIPQNLQIQNVQYIQGNCLNPSNFEENIFQADTIIHSIGVLLDSTVLKNGSPNDQGSYETINFETAKQVGLLANQMNDKKRKFIYISANQYPPMLQRYLSTKLAAEEFLRNQTNLQFYTLRPGLIKDQERPFVYPLAFITDLLKFTEKSIQDTIGQIKYASDLLNFFKVEKSIERNQLAQAIALLAVSDQIFKEINLHDDIVELSKEFKNFMPL